MREVSREQLQEMVSRIHTAHSASAPNLSHGEFSASTTNGGARSMRTQEGCKQGATEFPPRFRKTSAVLRAGPDHSRESTGQVDHKQLDFVQCIRPKQATYTVYVAGISAQQASVEAWDWKTKSNFSRSYMQTWAVGASHTDVCLPRAPEEEKE